MHIGVTLYDDLLRVANRSKMIKCQFYTKYGTKRKVRVQNKITVK